MASDKQNAGETDSKGRPIRRAVCAETGKQLLQSIDKRKRFGKSKGTKREISSSRLDVSEQSVKKKMQKLKIDPEQARKPGVIPKMWTKEEDQLLHAAIQKHGERNWRAIAEQVPGRSYIQCLQRWKKALRPGLKKGHWSKEEDERLLELVEQFKPDFDWGEIAKSIIGRNAKQCRERWFLNLDPSINRGPWSPEEDAQLLSFVANLGGRWSLIAKHMPGRTENSVKTRFMALQRKEQRNRKWTKEEDDKIIEKVLEFGREFEKFNGVIKGRTKGQIKKRFSILSQQKPDLIRNVYAVEDRIRQQRAQEAIKSNVYGSGQQQVKMVSPPPVPPTKLIRQASSFAGKVDPVSEYGLSARTPSTGVVQSFLQHGQRNQRSDYDLQQPVVSGTITGNITGNNETHHVSPQNTSLQNYPSSGTMLASPFFSNPIASSNSMSFEGSGATSPSMQQVDRLFEDTKSKSSGKGTPTQKGQTFSPPRYPNTSASFMPYNPSGSRTSFPFETPMVGPGPVSPGPVMHNPNSIPQRPIGEALSQTSFGLGFSQDFDSKGVLQQLL